MRSLLTGVLCSLLCCATRATAQADDWLVAPAGAFPAKVEASADGRVLHLTNGLVRRSWVVAPNLACYALDDLMTGRSLLRAVRPEARLMVDGEPVDVGGLVGQPNQAFLTRAWLDQLRTDPQALRYVRHEVVAPRARFAWPRVRHHAPGAAWPPPGVGLRFDFGAPPERNELAGLTVSVHYELYAGVPVLQKWVTLHNGTGRQIELDRCAVEVLAAVEHGNHVETRAGVALQPPRGLHVETDYAFGSFKADAANRFAVHWRPDPEYATQVNYLRQTPCLLLVEPSRGPDVLVADGADFASLRAFELVHDSTERERRGLAQRRMYRTIAPWVTENPLILHVVSSDGAVVRRAIDQAAECGFEMVSLSFGSGLDMEDVSVPNRQKFKALASYARERGIHLGGYSLLSSRRIGDGQDVVPPSGEKATHGNCPALTSDWGQSYFAALRGFFEETGFLQFTHDGSYPGDFDVTSRPPLQRGLDDSQWVQWRVITAFYRDLLAKGVYLRVPDYYYLSGSNECGMGYRETNWSLPRDQQVIHTRQNIYDGTWQKTPSMGWMFVPLTQYHGGGAAATIEPLDEHRDHYRRMLDCNLGLGVQAVYRGTRLYDTDRVRDLVSERVAWFKRYRTILEADVVHGRRADGRDLDWMLHVDPRGEHRGMLVVFNPTHAVVERTLQIDLYYTGLDRRALLTDDAGRATTVALDRRFRAPISVRVPARGMAWVLVDAPRLR